VTSSSFTEGWTEGMWQFLGQAKTCSHEGVDDDHVPQLIEILQPNGWLFCWCLDEFVSVISESDLLNLGK